MDSLAQSHKKHAPDVRLCTGALAGNEPDLTVLGKRLECVPRLVYHRNQQLGAPLALHELPDLSQDVLSIVWRKLPTYDGRAALETWIYRIGSFELMNLVRKKRRRATKQTELQPDQDGDVSMDWVEAPPSTPAHLSFEGLYLGLDQLSADDEAILRRKHYDELSFEEIGVELGLQTSGAKHRYYTALRRLRLAMPASDVEGERDESPQKS